MGEKISESLKRKIVEPFFRILPLDYWNHWNHFLKMKRRREQPAVHWFLTNNNLTFTDDDYIGTIVNDKLAPHLTWCQLGCHIGRKSGRIHLHAVIALKRKKRKTALRKIYPAWDIEPRYGSIESNKVYLSKNNEYRELGIKPKGTLKDRWAEVVKCAKEHRIGDIEPMMQVKFYGNIKRIAADNPVSLPSLPVKKCHYWIYNPVSDAGKTWYAEHRWPGFYPKKPQNKWWGGYNGQDAVIINNVTPEHMYKQSPLRMNLVSPWADTPAFNCEIKGEEFLIRPKCIIVTSQYSIEQIFGYSNTELNAAYTRFILLDLEHVDTRRIKAKLIMRRLAQFVMRYNWIMNPYLTVRCLNFTSDVIIDL